MNCIHQKQVQHAAQELGTTSLFLKANTTDLHTTEVDTTAQTGIRYNMSNRTQVQHGKQEKDTTVNTGSRYNNEYRNQVPLLIQELGTSGKRGNAGISYNSTNRNYVQQLKQELGTTWNTGFRYNR